MKRIRENGNDDDDTRERSKFVDDEAHESEASDEESESDDEEGSKAEFEIGQSEANDETDSVFILQSIMKLEKTQKKMARNLEEIKEMVNMLYQHVVPA